MISLFVNSKLSSAFRDKVNEQQRCSIKNVLEIIRGELLEYWIECPSEKIEHLTELAFMTFIKNKELQKYYANHRDFKGE